MTLEKFEVRARFTNAVQFVAEIECNSTTRWSVKLGLAVKWALKAGANLYCADLSCADLSGANLYCADLSGANLYCADLPDTTDGKLALCRTRILPEGTIIGWKKLEGGLIAKLEIPPDAKRSHAFGRKCRAEFAKVLEIIGAADGRSQHDNDFVYRAGETVRPHEWSDDWRKECAGGIHFYITREEAEAR